MMQALPLSSPAIVNRASDSPIVFSLIAIVLLILACSTATSTRTFLKDLLSDGEVASCGLHFGELKQAFSLPWCSYPLALES
jgi:hypothetical protein